MKVTYFSSGEFARLCGTTKETLRHYHNIGLLVPARTTENGYHYYASFQFYDYLANCEIAKQAKFQRFFLLKIEQLLNDLWYNIVANTISTTSRKEL